MKHALGVAPSWRAESVYPPQLASAKYQCRSNQRSSRHPGEPVRRADACSQPVRRMHASWGRESAGTCDARSEQLYALDQRKLRITFRVYTQEEWESPPHHLFRCVTDRTGWSGGEEWRSILRSQPLYYVRVRSTMDGTAWCSVTAWIARMQPRWRSETQMRAGETRHTGAPCLRLA